MDQVTAIIDQDTNHQIQCQCTACEFHGAHEPFNATHIRTIPMGLLPGQTEVTEFVSFNLCQSCALAGSGTGRPIKEGK